MSLLILMAGLFVVSALLTGLCRALAQRVSWFDVPVDRSAHSRPIPVSGGLAIVSLFLLVVGYYSYSGLIPYNESMALLASALVALLGLIDDLRPVHIRWRIPLQFVAAGWVVWQLGRVPAIDLGFVQIGNRWLLTVLAIFALVWLLNLFNFMDGIDGIAASELIFVNLMALLFVINSADTVLAMLCATLLAAGAGFLLWNWPPAKIFMGDVGSGFIGFSLGIMALLSMQHGSMTVWTWVLLLGVFITDASFTLFRRIMQSERWYEGHSSHAYQNAARYYKSHRKVTIRVIVLNCLWLAPLAWFSVYRPELGFYLAIIGITPLVVLANKLQAGRTVDADKVTHQV